MTLRPHPRVRVLESRGLFRGRVFDLVRQVLELPSGLRQEWELVEHPGAAAILPVGADGRVLVVRQFRPPAGDWTFEIPAGRLEPGEDPLRAAQRELEEETGYRAGSWRPLTSFLPAIGFCSEVLHLYEARDLEPVEGGGLAGDADEEIEVTWMEPRELLAVEPRDAKTVIAVQALLLDGAR